MLIYDVLAGVFGLVAGGFILLALIEAARTRRFRWVVTILLLPIVGAIGWWVAGRRAYGEDSGDTAAGSTEPVPNL